MMSAPFLHKFDKYGFYLGSCHAQPHPVNKGEYLLENLDATPIPLPNSSEILEGWNRYRFKKDKNVWEVDTDYRGREGYLNNGAWIKLQTPDLPDNWHGDKPPSPELTAKGARAAAIEEIKNELSNLDTAYYGNLSTIISAQLGDENALALLRKKHADHEKKAEILRVRLRELQMFA